MFAALPLTALRSFESAARLGSFKAAADELAVTPTAVSHQVRALERWLGLPLFEREPRRVRLTTCGERLFQGMHAAFLDIAQTVDQLRPRPSVGGLTVTTTPAFAALWLIPRLGRFHATHPAIQLRLDTTTEPLDLHRDASVDVALRYGVSRYPSLHSQCLLDECFAVYGAPALVARLREEGGQVSLITVRWRACALYELAWKAWCAAAGEEALLEEATLHEYDEEHYALQAAIAGQGLVLASSILVSESLRRGLLAPYRPEVTVPGAGYTALCVPGRERHPPVRAFLDWLRHEVEAP